LIWSVDRIIIVLFTLPAPRLISCPSSEMMDD
jgi:hypothetical protein